MRSSKFLKSNIPIQTRSVQSNQMLSARINHSELSPCFDIMRPSYNFSGQNYQAGWGQRGSRSSLSSVTISRIFAAFLVIVFMPFFGSLPSLATSSFQLYLSSNSTKLMSHLGQTLFCFCFQIKVMQWDISTEQDQKPKKLG